MRTFVVPDIHGRYDSLVALLEAAGVINENGERWDVAEAREFHDEAKAEGDTERADFWFNNERHFRVVSIGDLANGTLTDQNGDEQCLLKVRDWFDYLILGNHESGYLFNDMGFNGYYPAPHLKSLYNSLRAHGYVKPAVLVGETLLTHAGVHAYFDFSDAEEAFDAIYDVWEDYSKYENDWSEKFYFGANIEIPKSMLINAVSSKRGGSVPFGGILWSDWDEPKNSKFSQIIGHSPKKNGPVITEYKGTGVFHANIDCGAKKGLTPWGVWLDEYGLIEEYVTVPAPDLEEVA